MLTRKTSRARPHTYPGFHFRPLQSCLGDLRVVCFGQNLPSLDTEGFATKSVSSIGLLGVKAVPLLVCRPPQSRHLIKLVGSDVRDVPIVKNKEGVMHPILVTKGPPLPSALLCQKAAHHHAAWSCSQELQDLEGLLCDVELIAQHDGRADASALWSVPGVLAPGGVHHTHEIGDRPCMLHLRFCCIQNVRHPTDGLGLKGKLCGVQSALNNPAHARRVYFDPNRRSRRIISFAEGLDNDPTRNPCNDRCFHRCFYPHICGGNNHEAGRHLGR
mmetsp:Transcript_130848/g.419634  ORF Transcript_130848/g.419634 Transcript_130848/m.419634 type:complete len:273 (+) Transcript_130848:509-1327(+)